MIDEIFVYYIVGTLFVVAMAFWRGDGLAKFFSCYLLFSCVINTLADGVISQKNIMMFAWLDALPLSILMLMSFRPWRFVLATIMSIQMLSYIWVIRSVAEPSYQIIMMLNICYILNCVVVTVGSFDRDLRRLFRKKKRPPPMTAI